MRSAVVGGIRIEQALDGPRRHLQSLMSRRDFHGFEVEGRTRGYERLDLPADFNRERRLEPFFLALSAEAAACAGAAS